MRYLRHAILPAVHFFLAACGSPTSISVITPAPQPTATTKADYVDHLLALGVNQYLGITPATTATFRDWQTFSYDVNAGAACLEGTDYFVALRPSASAKTDEAILYLQGGGACWNELTCFGVGFASKEADMSGRNGMLDKNNLRNPVRDWPVVFAPYCDGSVFSGDNIAQYGQHTAYHWGLRNLSAAVTVLRQHTPNPKRILVTGSSAGGFGTFMAMGVVRAAFPDAYILLMNDSGPGLENPALLPTMGTDIRRNWKFEQFLPDDCTACEDQLIHLIDYALANDPDTHIGLFSYLDDAVIGSIFLQFYSDYPGILRDTTDRIHNAYPDRFRRYFIDGYLHTILLDDLFYGGGIQQQPFYQWFNAFLEHDLEHWTDRR